MRDRNIIDELSPVFYPRSIALVGISNNFTNVGQMFLHSLLAVGFPKIYPVNPKGGEMAGVPVYSTIEQIPDEVDLALITVPRESVLEATRECAKKGVKVLVLYSGGFGEAGPEGRQLEQEVVRVAHERGTRIIGPNCVGPFNPSAKLIPQYILPRESGHVGIISHSGFLLYYLIMSVTDTGLLPSKGISCGSDCDLSCVDFIDYLGNDQETKVIIAYLEGIRDGARLLRTAREISHSKPIIVYKGGHTDAGMKASASHTGTLAVSTSIWETLCKQTGIVSVDSFEQLMDTMLALYHLKAAKGKRVAIITTPGGLAVTATDACRKLGLEIPRLTQETQNQLSEILENVGTSVVNPVDLGMIGALHPDTYMKEAIRIISHDPNIDMLMPAFTGPPFDDDEKDKRTADIILNEIAVGGKPTVICGAIPEGWSRGELRFIEKSNVPVYPDPKRAAVALAKLAEYSEFLRSL